MTPHDVIRLLEVVARAYVVLSRASAETLPAEVERLLPQLGDALEAKPAPPPPADADRYALGRVRAVDDLL